MNSTVRVFHKPAIGGGHANNDIVQGFRAVDIVFNKQHRAAQVEPGTIIGQHRIRAFQTGQVGQVFTVHIHLCGHIHLQVAGVIGHCGFTSFRGIGDLVSHRHTEGTTGIFRRQPGKPATVGELHQGEAFIRGQLPQIQTAGRNADRFPVEHELARPLAGNHQLSEGFTAVTVQQVR